MEPISETLEAIEELDPYLDEGGLLEQLTCVATGARAVAPEIVGVSVAVRAHGVTFTLVATDVVTAALDGVQYVASGPCVDGLAAEQGVATTAQDLLSEPRWRAFGLASAAAGVRSTLTFPILNEGSVVGTVNICGGTEDAFTGKHEELAEVFGAWAPGAVANADLSFTTRRLAARRPSSYETKPWWARLPASWPRRPRSMWAPPRNTSRKRHDEPESRWSSSPRRFSTCASRPAILRRRECAPARTGPHSGVRRAHTGEAMRRRLRDRATGAGAQVGQAEAEMRAVVQDRYGAVDALRHARIARPEIADDEVLVRVRAAGLDRGTWHLMTGKPYLMRIAGLGLMGPKNQVLGRDLAGTVAAVGADVTGFAVGDEVYGVGRGSFAEYTAASPDKLARKPAGLSYVQAAVVPISASTALQALTDHGRLVSGQHVLVIGASGGVGSYAVQLAKALGGEVTGVASTAKLDLVRSLGADHVIDYTREDFAGTDLRYDLILDIGGNPSLRRLRRALTPTGTAVIVGGEEGGALTGGLGRSVRALALSPLTRQRFAMFINKESASDLDRLTGFIDASQVTPSIDRTFPLDHVPEAMRQLAAGRVRGKIAITI